MTLEELDALDLPSATLLGTTLLVQPAAGHQGVYSQDVSLVNGNVVATEDGVVTGSFPAAAVTSLLQVGDPANRNALQNSTAISGTLVGGMLDDDIFGGQGTNTILPLWGDDIVYSLLGKGDTIVASGDGGTDLVYTNPTGMVSLDATDHKSTFFAPNRTPGSGFLGTDPALNDGTLYVTPSNNGSYFYLNQVGGTYYAYYDLDITDRVGPQVRTFTGLTDIAYFGGAGNDVYVNNSALRDAAYGGAGNDTLSGGSTVSVLKGLGGNDVILTAAPRADLSGNAGSDFINYYGRGPGEVVFRIDQNDQVVGRRVGDISVSP